MPKTPCSCTTKFRPWSGARDYGQHQGEPCGKVVRELAPGTLEVHLLKDYGAVEIGVHRFLHPFSQHHGVVGEAKFIHVWQLKGGAWRITQVISYDHRQAK